MLALLSGTKIVITTFISSSYFVTLPIMTSISITLLVLAKKGKLGRWGKMFINQMQRNQRGKRAIFEYGTSILLLTIIISTIYTIHYGENSSLTPMKQELYKEVPQLKEKNIQITSYVLVPSDKMLKGLLAVPAVLMYQYPQLAVMLSALNDQSSGWLLNFYMVSLIEYGQVFGLLVLYRVILPRKNIKFPVVHIPKIRMTKRIALVLVFIALFTLSYQLGTYAHVGTNDAKTVMSTFKATTNHIDAVGIFTHNTEVALLMFVPALGVVIGTGAGYSTGMVYNAAVVLSPALATKLPPLALLFMSPFGIMELTGYSIAMSRSFILIGSIRKKTLRKELKPTLKEIGLVVGILLVAGFIEYSMILSGSKGIG